MLLVATRKGLWQLKSDATRRSWRITGPQFLGHVIHHCVADARDGKTMLCQASDRLRVLKAGEKAPDKKDADKPGRESGWIDLSRVKVSIQPAAEWRQMFQEAWRLQLEQFWTEDLSGIDWEAVNRLYQPLVWSAWRVTKAKGDP